MTPTSVPPCTPVSNCAPTTNLVSLCTDEQQSLNALAESVTAAPRQDPDSYCRQAKQASDYVPGRIADFLRDFDDVGNSAGFIVIKGIPVGPVPNTPPDNTLGLASATLHCQISTILGAVIGHQISYQAECYGHLWQDVVPNRHLVYAQQSQGSGVELEAHTEQCFSDLRPDYVLLGCLRGDPMAQTYVMTSRTFERWFTAAELRELREPLWTTSIDESFRPYIPNPDEVRGPFPILSGPMDNPNLRLDQDLMSGLTKDAQGLLDKVVRAYREHRDSYVLQSSDLLILDNHKAMHGRSIFLPQFDGGDRWISRGFLVRDHRRFAYATAADRRTVLAVHS